MRSSSSGWNFSWLFPTRSAPCPENHRSARRNHRALALDKARIVVLHMPIGYRKLNLQLVCSGRSSNMQNDASHEPIVRMVSIGKSFTGTDAVQNVDLEFLSGEVHGLVGENGAGKSTLMRILAGIYPDYRGEIFFKGRPTRIHTPRLARELGIAMVHQELSLVQ